MTATRRDREEMRELLGGRSDGVPGCGSSMNGNHELQRIHEGPSSKKSGVNGTSPGREADLGTSERCRWSALLLELRGPATSAKQPAASPSMRSRTSKKRFFFAVGLLLILAVAIVVGVNLVAFRGPHCRGMAACLTGGVTYIVDGDTLDVGSTRVGLALVNTPEAGQTGYQEAKDFTAQTCPVGTQALVDEDDGQTAGSYGRTIAVVYCGGVNLNEALLKSGYAELVSYYCSVSEFADQAWTDCP
ncbi:hypothetical protein E6H29_01360 [Candidatus Bathyarchaeota archaeon]|nr:MAG: hypothetical protein E6H29_01360 [Candidatus Bathyarchaeota archaeon]